MKSEEMANQSKELTTMSESLSLSKKLKDTKEQIYLAPKFVPVDVPGGNEEEDNSCPSKTSSLEATSYNPL